MSHQRSSNLCLLTRPTNEVWQKVRHVITWVKDRQTGRRPLYKLREWKARTPYFLLHLWTAHEFGVSLNLMTVKRNDRIAINSLHDTIPSARILVLYYSKTEVPVYHHDIFGDLYEESESDQSNES